MQYVLQVNGSVYGTQSAYLAFQFAQQLLKSGHTLAQIFFYQAGVNNGNGFVNPANDEFNLQKAWQDLADNYQVKLNICMAAAQRRGVVEPDSAKDYSQDNLAAKFELAGLAEFSQAVLSADRLVTF